MARYGACWPRLNSSKEQVWPPLCDVEKDKDRTSFSPSPDGDLMRGTITPFFFKFLVNEG